MGAALAAALYLVFRPWARFLLRQAQVSVSTYTVGVWIPAAAVVVVAAFLVLGWMGISGGRRAWISALASAVSIGLFLAGVAALFLLPDRLLGVMASEPAAVGLMLVWSAETVLVSWLAARVPVARLTHRTSAST